MTQGTILDQTLKIVHCDCIPFCDDLYRPRLKNSVDDFSEDGNAIMNFNDLKFGNEVSLFGCLLDEFNLDLIKPKYLLAPAVTVRSRSKKRKRHN